MFDIVAGASIRAVNSCILVNQVVQNHNSWENSWDTLYRFWDDLKNPTLWNDFASDWWDHWHHIREIWNKFWKPIIEQNQELTSWRESAIPLAHGITDGLTSRSNCNRPDVISVANLSLLPFIDAHGI